MDPVLLVTCADLPDGEPGGALLVEALAARGIPARWVAWDDPGVDWAAAPLVAVRSAWDYSSRLEEFLSWARSVGPALLNGADTFAWNTDKRYLVELADAGVPVVPTLVVEDESELPPAVADCFPAVVKPRVGVSGRGVVVFDGEPGGPDDLDESQLGPGPWVVQPLVASVRTEGEVSVFVLGGTPVCAVRKVPAPGEIRVHEEYGGRTDPVPLDPEAGDLARRAIVAAQDLLGHRLGYGRVDLMRADDGRLVVGEVEVTEPGLYLDVVPANAEAFADVVAEALGRTGADGVR
jgi:glutathione synthase/RimK-type ligase-like ATP-grasp enzyme